MLNCSICLGVRLSKSISKKSSKSTHTVSITVSKNAQNVKTITKQLAKRTNCGGSVLQTDRSSSALSSFSPSLLVNPSCISANCAALSAAPAAIIMVLWKKITRKPDDKLLSWQLSLHSISNLDEPDKAPAVPRLLNRA